MVDSVGESGHLAVLHGRDVVYLVEERARMRPSLVTDIGVRIPAHLAASGRAMLAALPAAQVRILYSSAGDFVQRTGAATTPRSTTDLRRILERVRAEGVAWESGEVTPSFCSVAAAIRDTADWPIAAAALTWQEGTLSEPKITECEAAVRREARMAAKALGGRAD